MTEAELDTPLDFNGPGKVGCLGLGTAAVIVIDDETSMVDALYNCCRFFAHESCGQCTPCRQGTSWSARILERIRDGRGESKDLDTLMDIANGMGIIPGTTICGLSDGAAWPIKNAIKKFRPEFEEYIASKRRAADPVPHEKMHPHLALTGVH
jgi:NADH-quinone oxidoreductase subunit F